MLCISLGRETDHQGVMCYVSVPMQYLDNSSTSSFDRLHYAYNMHTVCCVHSLNEGVEGLATGSG